MKKYKKRVWKKKRYHNMSKELEAKKHASQMQMCQ